MSIYVLIENHPLGVYRGDQVAESREEFTVMEFDIKKGGIGEAKVKLKIKTNHLKKLLANRDLKVPYDGPNALFGQLVNMKLGITFED